MLLTTELRTIDQVAEELHRNSELIRRWLRSDRLKGHKLAGRWFVTRKEISRFKRSEPQRRARP